MPETILDAILGRENDYTELEVRFHRTTGVSLVRNPVEATHNVQVPARSVSVVIPAWDVAATLPKCLLALGWSDYIARHPGYLQVVVVDDGSTDGTSDVIQNLALPYELVVLSQAHLGRAHAVNAGLAFAEGDVLISCDADMLLSPLAISEAVLRVSAEPAALYTGFRRDLPSTDPSISVEALRDRFPVEASEFWGDNRFTYHWAGHTYPGWPRNMFTASDGAKCLGRGRAVLLPDGDHWSLPRMVYGALYALDRSWLRQLGALDERFVGWGYDDTFFAAKAVAAGMFIVPVLSFTGIHISHPDRTPRQSEEGVRNRARLNAICSDSSLADVDQQWGMQARSRVTRHERRAASITGDTSIAEKYRRDVLALSSRTSWQLNYLAAQGLWRDASQIVDVALGEALAADPLLAAEVSRRAGDMPLLERLREELPGTNPAVELEYAFALCELGDETTAIRLYRQLSATHRGHREVRYLQRGGPGKHLRRAKQYLDMGMLSLAREDLIGAFLASGGEIPLSGLIPNRVNSKRACVL